MMKFTTRNGGTLSCAWPPPEASIALGSIESTGVSVENCSSVDPAHSPPEGLGCVPLFTPCAATKGCVCAGTWLVVSVTFSEPDICPITRGPDEPLLPWWNG